MGLTVDHLTRTALHVPNSTLALYPYVVSFRAATGGSERDLPYPPASRRTWARRCRATGRSDVPGVERVAARTTSRRRPPPDGRFRVRRLVYLPTLMEPPRPSTVPARCCGPRRATRHVRSRPFASDGRNGPRSWTNSRRSRASRHPPAPTGLLEDPDLGIDGRPFITIGTFGTAQRLDARRVRPPRRPPRRQRARDRRRAPGDDSARIAAAIDALPAEVRSRVICPG